MNKDDIERIIKSYYVCCIFNETGLEVRATDGDSKDLNTTKDVWVIEYKDISLIEAFLLKYTLAKDKNSHLLDDIKLVPDRKLNS